MVKFRIEATQGGQGTRVFIDDREITGLSAVELRVTSGGTELMLRYPSYGDVEGQTEADHVHTDPPMPPPEPGDERSLVDRIRDFFSGNAPGIHRDRSR